MLTNVFAKIAHAAQLAVATVQRHAVAAGVGGALIAASAGGGLAYAASRPSTAVPVVSSPAASPSATPGAKSGHQRHRGALALRALIGLVAKDTHQTRAQVLAQLKAGKSLDAIAGSQASAIQQTVLTKLQTRLAARVKAGKITQDQASKRLAAFKALLLKVMSEPRTSLPMGHSRPSLATPTATAA
jgi:hypothetical protein